MPTDTPPAPDDGLRERIAEALRNAQREWMRPGSDAGQHLMTDHMAAAVLAVLDAPSPTVDDGLRERYAAAIRDGIINHIDPDYGLEDAVEDAVSDVMRVRDRRMEQLPASRRLIAAQIDDLTTRAREDRRRAEIAEAELGALRGGIRETGGDPTKVQNLYAQLSSRTNQWKEAKAINDEAQQLAADAVTARERQWAEFRTRPTTWAYERACKALEKHRKRADDAEAAIGRLKELVEWRTAEVLRLTELTAQYADRAIANGKRAERAEATIARVRDLRERARTEEPMAQGPTWRGLDEALDGPQPTCTDGEPCPSKHRKAASDRA